MRSKLDQALSIIARLQARVRSWKDTSRNMSILLSENMEAVAERNALAGHPLGFTHGLMERIVQELGPEVDIHMVLAKCKLTLMVCTPSGVVSMHFADEDYNHDIDMLASSIRRVCEARRVLPKAS